MGTEFQNFIGKHINKVIDITGKLRYNADLNKYYIFSEEGYKFYGKTYHNVTITVNKQDIIKDITVYIYDIIDKKFYAHFNNNYGQPSKIMVVDTLNTPSFGRLEGGDLVSYSIESSISLKKGNFEDIPVLLTWNKKNYQIRVFIKHEINVSEIKFMLPTDKP